ncbi:hypothetical protein QE152_g7744 [Popillia japonica]|uniref:Retropepsins domain-containing protein n=1 Tax=Popillia japonica TaxID=7064 RepID=A0AAW1M929_POPJA
MDKWPSSEQDKKIKTFFTALGYMVASDMDKWPSSEQDKKIKTFFTALGSNALTKYNRFQLTADERQSIDTVIEAIRKKLSSKKVKKIIQCDDSEGSEVEEKVYKIDKIIDYSEQGGGVLAELEFWVNKQWKNYSEQGGGVLAELEFWVNKQWKNIKCELDTGATVCVIGKDILKKNFGENIVISKTNHKLQGFGGSKIPLIGEIYLRCKVKNRKYDIKFMVVNVDHEPLLSAKCCKALGLINFCSVILSDKNVDFYKRGAQNFIGRYEAASLNMENYLEKSI